MRPFSLPLDTAVWNPTRLLITDLRYLASNIVYNNVATDLRPINGRRIIAPISIWRLVGAPVVGSSTRGRSIS